MSAPSRNFTLTLFSFLLLLVSFSTFAQSRESKRFIKEVNRLLREHALVKEQVDWSGLEKDLSELDYVHKHESDREKIIEVYRNHLTRAGDSHSLFVPARKQAMTNVYNSPPMPEMRLLEGGVAYLKIPALLARKAEVDKSFTQELMNQIRKADSLQVRKWILDLRGNSGGNVWPMLAGLTPLIGGGTIAYSVGRREVSYELPLGRIAFTQIAIPTFRVQSYKRLAILIDDKTASSGELLAICLSGLHNTRTFGRSSRGLTTFNKTFELNEGTLLYLATGYMADRNKRHYVNGITPEVQIPKETAEDVRIQLVLDWINE